MTNEAIRMCKREKQSMEMEGQRCSERRSTVDVYMQTARDGKMR